MKRNTLKKTAALMLALGALAQPAFAVTNIDKCQTITQSGLYKLTKDLGPSGLLANGDCLVLKASDVTIDLVQHTITGNGNGTGTGVVQRDNDCLDFACANASVPRFFRNKLKNGKISGFRTAVRLRQSASVEGLTVRNNLDGIFAGPGAVIRKNTAVDNDNTGMFGLAGSLVADNRVEENGGVGIGIEVGSVVARNIVSGNGEEGIRDFIARTRVLNNDVVANSRGVELTCAISTVEALVIANHIGLGQGPGLDIQGTLCSFVKDNF